MRKLIIIVALLITYSATAFAQAPPICRVEKTFYKPGTTQPDPTATVTLYRQQLANYAFSRTFQVFKTNSSGVLLGADGQPGMQLACNATVYLHSSADVGLPGIADNPSTGTQYIVRNTNPQQLEELGYARTLLTVKGALVVGGTTLPGQLLPGANGTVLRSDSTQALGLKWDPLSFSLMPALTANRALISNGSGVVSPSNVTATELDYLSGVTAAVQTQINSKAASNNAALTGVPTAPTAANGTNSNQLATTAFVANAVSMAGGGSVSNFSAGNLSPLFTTSVTNSTSTPSLTFNLSNAGAHTFFGNNTGSTGAPAFVALTVADIPDLSSLYAATAHTHTFASLTSKPTTLSGYGITDAQPLNTDLTTISGLTPNNDDVLQRKAGAWTNRSIAQLRTDLGVNGAALTKVDDTNVTLTLGGTPNTALLNAASITVGWTGTLAKARQHANTVYTDQANTFGAFIQTFQAGANYLLVDPTDTTKKFQFDASNISTATTRTVNVPNANSTTVQASAAGSNQFATGVSAQGVVSYAQPSFSNLSGSLSSGQDYTTGVSANTYRSVTVNTAGRVTAGTNPTTFSGYGLSDTSANLAAALTDEIGSSGGGLVVFNQSPTIVTPTIASFINATHSHQNAAGGGTLDGAAIASGTVVDARLSTNVFLVDGTRAGVSTATSADAFTWTANSVNTGDHTMMNATGLTSGSLIRAAIPASGFTGRIIDIRDNAGSPADKFVVDATGKIVTGSADAALLTSGQLNGGRMPALTGDVTSSAGSVSTTISNNVVTNAKLATVSTATFKGRTTAGTGNVEDLTATQATALLNVMVGDSGSGGTKGLVPAPAAGDATKCLSGAGTYVSCSGAGGTGDVSSNTATSVDSELALFNGTTGKSIKRATGTGYAKLSSGVLSVQSTPIPASDVSGAALTKADDTNVTLTLGGTPSTALLNATSITVGWTGTLAKARQHAATAYTDQANTFAGRTILSGGMARTVRNVTGSATIAAADVRVDVNGSAANTQTLPALSAVEDGWETTITDVGNNAATNTITVSRAGSDTFLGGTTSVSITCNRCAVGVRKAGSVWALF